MTGIPVSNGIFAHPYNPGSTWSLTCVLKLVLGLMFGSRGNKKFKWNGDVPDIIFSTYRL